MNKLIGLTVAAAVAGAGAYAVKKCVTCDSEGAKPYPAEEIAQGIYKIDDYGMAYTYLIVGSERALLIDTGVGTGDLKARIAEITDLPVTVAATHGHVDHIGGAGQFDEIFLHPDDFSMVRDVTPFLRKGFSALQKLINVGDTRSLSLSSVEKFGSIKPVDMPDGFVFDLGDRSVTVTHTPGHTKGSCMFTDSKTNIIIGGDNTGIGVLMFFKDGSTMEHYAESMGYIYDKAVSAPAVYGGHIGSDPMPNEKISALAVMATDISHKNPLIFSRLPILLLGVDTQNGVMIVYRTDRIA